MTDEEKVPDTMPVPTPLMQPCVECGNDYAEGYCPHGVTTTPASRTKRKRPDPAIRPVEAMLIEIEKREGVVEPTLVLIVLKAYRSLEATNRAQREIIERHVETIARLKRTDERMRKQLIAEQKARRRASR